MQRILLVLLVASVSALAAPVEPQSPVSGLDSACEGQVVAQAPVPAITPNDVPSVELNPSKVDAELQRIVEDFQSGKITGIDVVNSYKIELGEVQAKIRANPLIRGNFTGEGVGPEMQKLEPEMRKLSTLMSQFDPTKYDPEQQSRVARAASWLKSVVGGQAENVVANFRSNEGVIMGILTNLDNGRASLEVDNRLLETEIARLREKMIALQSQIELWDLRSAKLKELEALVLARVNGADRYDSRNAKLQLDIVRHEMLLPIAQLVQMLEGQYDIFEATIATHRGQQDQNRLTVRTVQHLMSSAEEVLPAMVSMAVTTANNAAVQNLAKNASDLIHGGLNAIAKQMDRNADQQILAMKHGPISQEKILTFRDNVTETIEKLQKGKGEVLTEIERQRGVRAERIAKQKDLIEGIINSAPIQSLPSEE